MRGSARLCLALGLLVAGRLVAIEPPGLVYEAEDICSPKSAWKLNQRGPDFWCLWTEEDQVEQKRSRGASLVSPPASRDRERPEDGAPALHAVVDDLAPGLYQVFVSAPGGRPLAWSRDGETWHRYEGRELELGLINCPDGRFELWIDDRYAHPPNNPGGGYFDYIRFIPLPTGAAKVSHHLPWTGWLDTVLAQPGAWRVSALDCQLDGFEAEPGRQMIRAEGPPARFSYTFDRAGTYTLAVDMLDDGDGIEDLQIAFNGQEVGAIVGPDPQDHAMVAVLNDPLTVKPGDTLTFTARAPVGYYRVSALVFSPTPITPPPPSIDHLTAWSPTAGTAHLAWTTSVVVSEASVTYRPANAGDAAARTVTEPLTGLARNHQVILTDLDPAQEYIAEVTARLGDERITAAPFRFRPTPVVADGFVAQTIPLTAAEPTGAARPGARVSGGVPFARGALDTVDRLRLTDAAGAELPLQTALFSRWPDGSVQWAIVDYLAPASGAAQLVIGPDLRPAAAGLATVTETDAGWRITTEALSFQLGKATPALFDQVAWDRNGDGQIAEAERLAAAPDGANLRVVTEDGTALTCGAPSAFVVEQNGPVSARLRWSGPLVGPQGEAGWTYLIRATLTRGQPQLDLNLSLTYEQPGTPWTRIRSWSVQIPSGADAAEGSFDGQPLAALPAAGLSLQQDLENRYRITGGAAPVEGEQSLGVASLAGAAGRIDGVIPEFWQTYPSGWAITPGGLEARLLPELPADAYLDQSARDQAILYTWCDAGRYVFRAGQTTQQELCVRYGGDLPPEQLAATANAPLRPQVPPRYAMATRVLGRDLFLPGDGVWADYDAFYNRSFAALEKDRVIRRSYGWKHWGDWFGEREMNWGNNEYDLPWAVGIQYLRTGDRAQLDRGAQMARHYATVDALRGEFTSGFNGLQFEHSFDHTGTPRPPGDPVFAQAGMGSYLEQYGGGMLRGAIDRQGHIFEGGTWLYAALTGDPWLLETANRVCLNQAEKLTPNFNFTIERSGGWPLINMAAAYGFSGNPYYLNAARLMVERTLQRQDPASGGWLHQAPLSEVDGEEVLGGKAFAVGILTDGLLRYLEVEPEARPEVEQMLVRGADWLREEAWNPDKQGYRYISRAAKYRDAGSRGLTALLVGEVIAYAYEKTGDTKYLEFLKDNLAGLLNGSTGGMGKGFTQGTRQAIYGLDRARHFGLTAAPGRTIAQLRDQLVIEEGRARFSAIVSNPTDAPLEATLNLPDTGLPPVTWRVKPSAKIPSPPVVIDPARPGQLTVEITLAGFATLRQTITLAPPAPAPAARRGTGIAYVGPAESCTLRGLAASGLSLPAITLPTAAALSQYAGVMVASDSWKSPTIDLPGAAPALVEFCRAGGRVAIWQLNDDSWNPAWLPFDLFVFDDDTTMGELTAPQHPLFAGLGSLTGAKSYDCLGPVTDPWQVLATDGQGQPAIVEAALGRGRLLVIEPSFDRYAAAEGDQPDDAISRATAQQFMQNLARWLGE